MESSVSREADMAIRNEAAWLFCFCLVDRVQVKSGDYTIYVHIIEVRDLKAEDLQVTWTAFAE